VSFLVLDSTAAESHVRQATELHQSCLPELFLSRLGGYFVRRFYHELCSDSLSLTGVWLDAGQVVGVAAGGHDLRTVFNRISFHRAEFAVELLKRVLGEPRLIAQLVSSLKAVESPKQSGVELTYFAVSPEKRGQGVAQSLLNHYSRWWSTRGYSQLHLQVESDNERALQFYLKNGFEVVEKVRHGAYERLHLRRPI
jgi:ribosomal protein S18 acetylase RimI-like enzyme